MDWGELFCGNVANLFGSLVLDVDCKDYFGNPFFKKFDGITTIGLLLTLVMFLSFRVNIILGTLHIVLIPVPVVLFLVKIVNRTQGWFDHR
ncbi:MAG: hypothetical protein SOW84_03700 [Candidatus Faecousia sp.]|nr:hypothetical protein [Candidatus Faecousia sp.]